MMRRTTACLSLVLLITCANLLGANRVKTANQVGSLTKGAFECPSQCQECCDHSSGLSPDALGQFKCILVGSHSKDADRATKKSNKEKMKQSLLTAGFSCSTPTRRKTSQYQFKTHCSYNEGTQAATGFCSERTSCCCNKAEDVAENKCINPLDHEWYHWLNESATMKHDAHPVSKYEVLAAISNAEEYYAIPHDLTIAAVGKLVSMTHIIMDDKEWRPAHLRGRLAMKYSQQTGACSDGEGKWYVTKEIVAEALKQGEPAIQTDAGCCLETKMQSTTDFGFYGKEKYPYCSKWKQLEHCDEGMMYVETVGKRKGVCFGDQSTGASLAKVYGNTAAEFEAVAADARQTVMTLNTCPVGWTSHFERGGVRECTCDAACGGKAFVPNRRPWE